MTTQQKTARATGNAIEQLAKNYLQKQGLQAAEDNYYTRRGEIDLIMWDHDTLVFVEVRYRKNSHFGNGLESITRKKCLRLIAAAKAYLQQKKMYNSTPCRFDVLAVQTTQDTFEFHWEKNAFLDYSF